MKKTNIYLLLIMLLLSSCFKEDEKVTPHDPGNLLEAEVAMHQTYTDQVYFDLSSQESVSSNFKDDWDLAFENSGDGWHILLNSSCFMLAAGTASDEFSAPIDTTGMDWAYDPSDGNLDSTAIGRYFGYDPIDSALVYTNEVYVLNLGYDIQGNLRGLKKVIFPEVNDTSYTLKYANLDGTDEHIMQIFKDEERVFSYFSFKEGGMQLYPEPYKNDYDLLFTQYTTLLFTDEGDPYPYLLTGVVLNRHLVDVARDTTLDFDQIDYEAALNLEFTDQLDIIGYDWKLLEGDVTGGGTLVYVIVEGLHYVIRDTDGFLYKLRFTSFYNNEGVKGYPNFEYQRL